MSADLSNEKLVLNYWGYAEGKPDMSVPAHTHDYWQAHFSLSGSCLIKSSQRDFLLKKNEFIFIAHGVNHSLSYPEPHLAYSFKFYTNASFLPPVIHTSGGDFSSGVIQTVMTILETTFPKRFFGIPEGTIILPEDNDQLLMEYYLAGVLATFHRHQVEYGIVEKLTRLTVQRGRPYFTVTEAAEACNYSKNHFSLLLREQTGLNARDFLNQQRVGYACGLLRNSNLTIKEISLELGFSSQFHFSEFFKRMYGISPLHYRLQKK